MLLDLQTQFDNAAAVTVTAISTNVLDLRAGNSGGGPTLQDEGIVIDDLWLIVQTDSAADFAAAGAATLTITLESDTVVGLGSTPAVHFSSPAIPKATLVKSTTVVRTMLPSADYQRYLGLRYTVATGPFTAGAITAYLTPTPQRNKTYPVGFSVT
jgi:hypothetical protein